MKKKKAADNSLLLVQILEAKPNKLFSEQTRRAVRFLIYNRAVKCLECGRRKRRFWTMLCSFRASTPQQFTLKDGEVLMPLTPVCLDHPLLPAVPEANFGPTVASSKYIIVGPKPEVRA